MSDIYFGVLLVIVISVAAAMGSARLASGMQRRATQTGFVILLATATPLFGFFLHGRLLLARLLPFSNVIALANLIPIGLAAISGVLLTSTRIPLWRRWFLSACIWLVGLYTLLSPVMVEPPKGNGRWVDGDVLVQGNSASCSACAAATLLRHADIETDDAEMMRLCLTDTKGTRTLGLFRGLKLKADQADVEVVPFRSSPDELLSSRTWPVLLLVRLPEGEDIDPRYARDWGWTPGQGHAVVIFGRVGEDRLDVGDPGVGREQWMTETLDILWQGEGLRLRR